MDNNFEVNIAGAAQTDADVYGRSVATPTFDSIFEESERLRKLSSYQTEFDFNVYRDLELRFSDKPVRGGFIFKTPLKLVNHHSSCTKCHYSFELDSYGRGCFHNCVYCYALEQLTAHKYWNEPQPFPIDVTDLHKIFYTAFETDKSSKWRDILSKRIPLRIGSMSDSFMKMDIKYGITKEVLKILSHYDYPNGTDIPRIKYWLGTYQQNAGQVVGICVVNAANPTYDGRAYFSFVRPNNSQSYYLHSFFDGNGNLTGSVRLLNFLPPAMWTYHDSTVTNADITPQLLSGNSCINESEISSALQ